MKTLFTLLLLLPLTIIARENPFQPTTAYEEEQARMIELNEMDENYAVEFQAEQHYINEVYEKMNNPAEEKKAEKKEPKKPALTKEEVKKLIEKAKKETEQKTKEIVKKAVDEKPKEIEQVVYVKPRLDVTYEKEILPFVKVEYDNDKIDIHSDYKVSKKLTLPGKKKIILDYTAKKNFYTVRKKLESTNFLKVAVGNHKKDGYFRIVVELAQLPENYEVSYNDNRVTIVRLYEN
ncbi:AMIN domain-containing protein [Halarcobacter ebronensis]|uniref:AMIN domain-containing protein n=1 Tax=Halarcobacter ebronensis TaxID=1462615 RepID=UPI003C753199